MQDYRREQYKSRGPKQGRHAMEHFCVFVYFIDAVRVCRNENLKITDQMGEDEAEENYSGDSHHRFLADGGIVYAHGALN